MNDQTYSIVMFAYNEEKNIEKTLLSIKEQISEDLDTFYLIANGCTDNTIVIATEVKQREKFEKLKIIKLDVGDKCNAWNHYLHKLAKEVDVHFFVDADVKFSKQCFAQMTQKLCQAPKETVAIAGMPLSGRNREFYESLIVERSCFFGNLYGLRYSFIKRMQSFPFRLPIGLNWIDSFLTKAVNTDLTFGQANLPKRVCYLEGVGYKFDKLSLFSWDSFKLYTSRIARYELGKIQEKHLDRTPTKEWPLHMKNINEKIYKNFGAETKELSFVKKHMVYKRLCRLLKASKG